MSFLNAEWRKLAFANYNIDKDLLTEFLPFGIELDLWDEKCYVSLVGFMFVNTKLLGIRIPWHVNFEEVNLRFYVKRYDNGEWKRGVVFIKEIVPRPALSFIANTVFNENYETMPMSHHWEENQNNRIVEYKWGASGIKNTFKIKASVKAYDIEPNSSIEFITEHYWGYAMVNKQKSNEYEVTHPKWKIYKVKDYSIDVDFGLLYGAKFGFLNSMKPDSVMLAEGSKITVENKRSIK